MLSSLLIIPKRLVRTKILDLQHFGIAYPKTVKISYYIVSKKKRCADAVGLEAE